MLKSVLGEVVQVPRLVANTVSGAVGGAVSGIGNFVSKNFNLPSVGTLANEAASKLGASGMAGKFSNLANGASLTHAPQRGTPASYAQPDWRDKTTELKVIISQDPAVGAINQLVFDVMPRISESGSAEYEPLTPLHHPGAIQKYRYSNARTWSVSGRLMSRTPEEASRNLQLLNMIRSWRMPFFGQGTSEGETANLLGAPPPILTLKAYGPNMVGPAKCVLTNYSWDFDNQIDYIPTDSGNPFPVLLDITLSLTETWSPAEFSGFNLKKYKTGDLSEFGAFAKVGGVKTVNDLRRFENQYDSPSAPTAEPKVVSPARQADVRRIDNAIDAGGSGSSGASQADVRRIDNQIDANSGSGGNYTTNTSYDSAPGDMTYRG